MLARSIFILFFFSSSLAFGSSQVDLATFDSVWRVPLPPGHTVSVVEHSLSGARQIFEVVPELSVSESSRLLDAFIGNSQVLSAHTDTGRFDVRFHEPRAYIKEFGSEVWALVLHRPKALPLAEMMSPAACESWFSHLGDALREEVQRLCAGSLLVLKSESSGESADDAFVRRLLRGYLRGKPELHLANQWLKAHPSVSQASRELVQILRAVEDARVGESIRALDTIEEMLQSLFGKREEAALELGKGIYGRALVRQVLIERDLGIVLLYPSLARWGGEESISKEVWKRLAFLLDEVGEAEFSIDAIMSLIEFHGEEGDLLAAAHQFYLRVGKPYHAHLIMRRM